MAATWVVVSQSQTSAKDATGTYVPVVRIIFTVGADGPFSVDIPTATFSTGVAQAAIQAYADAVQSVQSLSGSTA